MVASDGSRLPTGTLTFLFTDIEGSTRMLSALGEQYPAVLETHSQILRKAIGEQEGTELSTEGDAFFAVFPSAAQAILAAVNAQKRLSQGPWPDGVEVRVRMGLHTGEGRPGGDNYVGLDVHRAARISAAGHGGQVLISDATRGVVASELPPDVTLRSLGEHQLKDLPASERIWQVDVAGLPSDFPALASQGQRPTNLPHPAAPFIGREHELSQVAELLGRRRLVTLIGPGGAGKTRLAIAAAEQLASRFRDGACFVALENAARPDDVVGAMASALGVREKPDRDLDTGLKAHVRERELLLVLDNFEQVMSAAPLVAELMRDAEGLRILVTSRSVLHLSGEQDFDVPPLGIPDPAHLPAPDALSQYEAVALFIERASAVKPGFAVTNENAPAVAEICSRLDGLPLAIELAAARIRLLSPQAILARLERRLPLLTGGAQDRPDRQRTLRGAIDWSYELLDEAERALFERLAVFAGGWTLETAEAVCNPDVELQLDLLEGMSSLTDKSLIRPMQADSGEDRFTMLQVLREFAAERLDSGPDSHTIRRRHALEVAALTEAAEPQLVGTQIRSWQQRLRQEEGNLRAALHWVIEQGEAELALRIAGPMWQFWTYWLRVREGVQWLEAVLALPGAADSVAPRAKALGSLAALEYWQGRPDEAVRRYQEALDLWRSTDQAGRVAETLHALAWSSIAQNDIPTAQAYAQQAIEAYRQAGDEAGRASVEAWLVTGQYILGASRDLDAAVKANHEAIDVNRRVGRMHEVADWTGSLAVVLWRSGDMERARPAVLDAVRAWSDIGNIGRMGFFKLVAAIELSSGHPERAARLGGAAERYREEVGGELPEHMLGAGDPIEDSRPLMEPDEHDVLWPKDEG